LSPFWLVAVFTRPWLVLLYVCFVIRNINYFVLVRFIQPPCISNLVQFSPCMLAQLAIARALEGVNNQTTKTIPLVARIEVYWQNVVWNRTVQLCRYFFDTLRNFSASLPRNIDAVASTWTLLLDADHQLDNSGSSAKLQRKRPGRFVRTRLLDADTPSQQYIALLVVARRRSQNMPTHAGSTWFVVNIRLSARLQSLLLARCWPACYALFSFFSLAVSSNTNSFILIVCMFWALS